MHHEAFELLILVILNSFQHLILSVRL